MPLASNIKVIHNDRKSRHGRIKKQRIPSVQRKMLENREKSTYLIQLSTRIKWLNLATYFYTLGWRSPVHKAPINLNMHALTIQPWIITVHKPSLRSGRQHSFHSGQIFLVLQEINDDSTTKAILTSNERLLQLVGKRKIEMNRSLWVREAKADVRLAFPAITSA